MVRYFLQKCTWLYVVSSIKSIRFITWTIRDNFSPIQCLEIIISSMLSSSRQHLLLLYLCYLTSNQFTENYSDSLTQLHQQLCRVFYCTPLFYLLRSILVLFPILLYFHYRTEKYRSQFFVHPHQ